MERLQKNSDVDWNERGELIIKGHIVDGSNIADLVNDAMRYRKHFEPRGWEAFAEVLRDSNVPQDLIRHRKRWEFIQRGRERIDKRSGESDSQSLSWTSWRS